MCTDRNSFRQSVVDRLDHLTDENLHSLAETVSVLLVKQNIADLLNIPNLSIVEILKVKAFVQDLANMHFVDGLMDVAHSPTGGPNYDGKEYLASHVKHYRKVGKFHKKFAKLQAERAEKTSNS